MQSSVDEIPVIEVTGLEKAFGPVKANDGISFAVAKGSVHALIGENGAGKSTMMNQIYGLMRPDAGEIRLNGTPVDFHSPDDAHRAGISMVHQHFMLVEPFTVLENVMLGFEGGALLNQQAGEVAERLSAIERDFGLMVPLDAVAGELAVGLRQRVEILKALYRGAEVLILDEPTGVLTPQEAEQLFQIIERLRDQGKSVIFISHKLGEVLRIADRATVIRAGRTVAEREIAETDEAELAELMIGKKVERRAERSDNPSQDQILRVDGISLSGGEGRALLSGISFAVRAGEILGLAGVAGNGQSELLEILTGMRRPTSGTVRIKEQVMASAEQCLDALAVRKLGLAHVAEDRLRTGAVGAMSAAENSILGYHTEPAVCRRGILNPGAIRSGCVEIMTVNDVRPSEPDLPMSSFSGGNQQKLVFGRESAHDPILFVAGEPTRGVDIGAVSRIHDRLIDMRNRGDAVLVVSSDLDELLTLSDRILVMFEGRIVGEVGIDDASERGLGLLMAGKAQETMTGAETDAR